MEFQVQTRVDGNGSTAAELSRRYQIPIQNIFKWNKIQKRSENATYSGAQPEETIPLSEHLKAIEELRDALKRAKRSLADMTVNLLYFSSKESTSRIALRSAAILGFRSAPTFHPK